MQYVKLDLEGRAYTYAWDGKEPLAPNEQVWIPPNSVNPRAAKARVIRLLDAADYNGPITRILCRWLPVDDEGLI